MSAVRVKLDENLSPTLAERIREFGHACGTVLGQNWSGKSDKALWPLIQQEGEMLFTADKGFGDVRAYPPGSHHGLVLFRPAAPSISAYARLNERLLQTYQLERLIACVVVVTDRDIRVRQPK